MISPTFFIFYSANCSPCLPSIIPSAILAVINLTALIASSFPGIT